MKTIVFVAAAVVVAGAAQGQELPQLFQLQTRLPIETKALKGAPYSAEVVNDHTQVLSDGNRIVQHSTGRVYRDSEGRVRREEDRAKGGPSISIVDPVAGVSYQLDPDRHIAWKTPSRVGVAIMDKLDAAKVEAMKEQLAKVEAEFKTQIAEHQAGDGSHQQTIVISGGRSNVATSRREQRTDETLPARTLEGLRVEGRRTTTTIAAGTIGNELPIVTVSEEWRSPDLQVLVQTERKDPRGGDSSYRLQGISRAEPLSSLFQIPSDYEVRETGIRRFDMHREER
jgi:hypothetical protein